MEKLSPDVNSSPIMTSTRATDIGKQNKAPELPLASLALETLIGAGSNKFDYLSVESSWLISQYHEGGKCARKGN
jgi:hypothetical protein